MIGIQGWNFDDSGIRSVQLKVEEYFCDFYLVFRMNCLYFYEVSFFYCFNSF